MWVTEFWAKLSKFRALSLNLALKANVLLAPPYPNIPIPCPRPRTLGLGSSSPPTLTLLAPGTEDHGALSLTAQPRPPPVTSSNQLQLAAGRGPVHPYLIGTAVAAGLASFHRRDEDLRLVKIPPGFQLLQAVQVCTRRPLAANGHRPPQGHEGAGQGLEGGLGQGTWKRSRSSGAQLPTEPSRPGLSASSCPLAG